MAFLRGLHSSHPAGQVILATLREAQRGYADMRGTWNRKSVETHAKRVVDRAETLDGVIAGKEFEMWVENLLRIAEVGVFLLLASADCDVCRPNIAFSQTLHRSLHPIYWHPLTIPSSALF